MSHHDNPGFNATAKRAPEPVLLPALVSTALTLAIIAICIVAAVRGGV